MNEIDDDLARRMLQDIALSGAASEENKSEIQLVLGSRANLNHVLNLSSGKPNIRPSVATRFNLILSIPDKLKAMSPFEIRCCLCRKVIAYPAWYYHVSYAVNQFHYFICFDASNNLKPTARCYRP